MNTEIKPTCYAQWQQDFLRKHQLDAAYLHTAGEWFDPLAQTLAAQCRGTQKAQLVAVNGCQGSGKTTVSDYLASALREAHGLHVVSLSLDDFYLTHGEREALAAEIHPLFATRGVPGTHDMDLLRLTLQRLLGNNGREPVLIPRFDKANDDRHPAAKWDRVDMPIHLVLLEGWCLGARPQAPERLVKPLNDLERDEDTDGRWRTYSNDILRRDFLPLYALVDQWIMLRAPSFDCVHTWRQEQEQKLAASVAPERATRLMDDAALRRFIQHYERITRDCLRELPQRVNHLFELDAQRQILNYTHRPDTE